MVLHDLVAPLLALPLLEAGDVPDWTPFVLAVIMLVALGLLWLSMRKHLKRADYPDEPAPDADRAASPASPADA